MLLKYCSRSLRACSSAAIESRAIRPRTTLPIAAAPHTISPSRPFSASSACLKKQKNKHVEAEAAPSKSPKASAPADDPFDLTALDADLSTAIDRLKAALAQLRTGGRFNPASLESLRVQPDKHEKTTYPLRDLAQVIPRSGREIHLLVSDAQHVKPVSSAILASSLNLTPQPDPTGQNQLMLVVKVPPPTAESRKAVVDAATKAGAVAADAVRNARGAQQKKLRKMELDKTVRKDDLRKAQAQMEDLVKKKGDEVKKVVEAAKKALDA